MKLYEIDNQINEIFDNCPIDENGEIVLSGIQESLLKALETDRQHKIESIIGFYKDIAGDVDKFDTEIKSLNQRKQVLKNKQESLKQFLDFIHQGVKSEYGVHKIGYRKSEVLVDGSISVIPEEFLSVEVSAKRAEIKKALKEGRTFEGWKIDERQNIQIK
jgi:hypothetical protein